MLKYQTIFREFFEYLNNLTKETNYDYCCNFNLTSYSVNLEVVINNNIENFQAIKDEIYKKNFIDIFRMSTANDFKCGVLARNGGRITFQFKLLSNPQNQDFSELTKKEIYEELLNGISKNKVILISSVNSYLNFINYYKTNIDINIQPYNEGQNNILWKNKVDFLVQLKNNYFATSNNMQILFNRKILNDSNFNKYIEHLELLNKDLLGKELIKKIKEYWNISVENINKSKINIDDIAFLSIYVPNSSISKIEIKEIFNNKGNKIKQWKLPSINEIFSFATNPENISIKIGCATKVINRKHFINAFAFKKSTEDNCYYCFSKHQDKNLLYNRLFTLNSSQYENLVKELSKTVPEDDLNAWKLLNELN